MENREITVADILPIAFTNGFGFATFTANCSTSRARVESSQLFVKNSFNNGLSVALTLEVRCGCGAEPAVVDTRMSSDGTYLHRANQEGGWVVKKFPAQTPFRRLKARLFAALRGVLKWKTTS